MQRRPLQPVPFDGDEFLTPLDRIKGAFFRHGRINSDILCAVPLVKADSFGLLFEKLGFVEMPLHPKRQKRLIYPEFAPEGAHPTGFVQFGCEIITSNHHVFELGDYSRIMRFDLKRNWSETENSRFYQIDEVQIWDGGIRYDIDCEDGVYSKALGGAINVSKYVIGSMWAREAWSEVTQKFDTVSLVIDELNEINDKLVAGHAEEMLGWGVPVSPNDRRTPP